MNAKYHFVAGAFAEIGQFSIGEPITHPPNGRSSPSYLAAANAGLPFVVRAKDE